MNLNQEARAIRRPQKPKRNDRGPRVNRMIRVREVRVIGAKGEQLGIMETRKAQAIADESGLDLVEVAPTVVPPVCKILDYGKYKYELKKKAKESKKKATVIQMKEVQFRPRTGDHDIEYKVKHITRFLNEGNKVRVAIRFRGREMAHTDLGRKLAQDIVDKVGEMGIVEQSAKMEGRILALVIAPNTKGTKAATQ